MQCKINFRLLKPGWVGKGEQFGGWPAMLKAGRAVMLLSADTQASENG